MKPKCTISLVTHNAGADITSCLDSLARQRFQDFEVMVIDNASSDDTKERIRGHDLDVTLIEESRNLGFGAAHNKVIGRAVSDWILVLNQDVILDPKSLNALMDQTTDERIGSVGPLLTRHEGKREVIDTAGLIRMPYYKVIDRYAGDPLKRRRTVPSPVWGISGACVLYRKRALQYVAHPREDRSYPEYFDEQFFMYKEDVDLAERLNRAGYKSWFAANAKGIHTRTGRPARGIGTHGYHRRLRPSYISVHSYKNHWYYLMKNAPIYALPVISVYELAKLGYLAVYEPDTLSVLPTVAQNAKLMMKRRYAS